ncbi:hypothetical protein [Beijerinckia indica]|uniref:Uncharacterized protein n=1 Tax=Beijerinckia indica subsp. indica (strain ATCC 9039 / DSM 1715 / NCIMB 8712) TaxID=395963 RepID=B2ILJ7_BEII9|nr:hypothetical protein [Beijerinckia indica]ACB97397.1 hypothetical protein Bind_3868 [Beijerinckia indica subsp. indica ATCC 9039]
MQLLGVKKKAADKTEADTEKKSLVERILGVGAVGVSLGALMTGQAFAQGASPAGGIGAQLNSLTSEAINSGGQAGQMAMYLAALLCFVAGVWALWQAQQPQNREGGMRAAGIAGIILCGLFATGGTWINKAAMSTGGKTATVSATPQTVSFQ